MNVEKNKAITDRKFKLILLLLFFSFFEESLFSWLSFSALAAMLLLPLVILADFIKDRIRLGKDEKAIIAAFIAFIVLQIACIRLDALYTSITPIYRSFTVLMTVLYARRLVLDVSKLKALNILTFVTLIIGFITFFFHVEVNSHILIGNYNTVGVLYFTLGIVNVIIYLKNRQATQIILFICCIAMILISVTRTALLLMFIMFALWLLLKIMPKAVIKPKIIYPLFFIVIIGFVWVYYNIKNLPVYSTLNSISQALFNKSFDSGRPDLWHMAVECVGNNIFFGQGTGIDLETFIPTVKTPHSVYFDIYLQNGIIGVVLYILCILVVIKSKGKWNKSSINLLLVSVVFVIVFYNALGIVFTKARSGIGLLQWLLIALPYSVNKSKLSYRRIINDKLNNSDIQCERVS